MGEDDVHGEQCPLLVELELLVLCVKMGHYDCNTWQKKWATKTAFRKHPRVLVEYGCTGVIHVQ